MTQINIKTIDFNRWGEFKSKTIEKTFRDETWPPMLNTLGFLSLLSALTFFLAGIGPIMDIGLTDNIITLSSLRAAASFTGLLAFLYSRYRNNYRIFILLLSAFMISVGIFESVEAIINYKAGIELETPFTLAIILICYLFFPLSLKAIMTAALFSSALNIASLKFFAEVECAALFQLTLFFVSINAIGTYLFIIRTKSIRISYSAQKQITELNRQLRMEIREKEKANRNLEQLTVTDPMTGISNRRKFIESIALEWHRFERYQKPFSLLIIDIDNFKRINDSYGHETGDTVICEISRRISEELRKPDSFFRIGGEEFAVIMPETDLSSCAVYSNRIREAVCRTPVNCRSNNITVSVSIGVSQSLLNGHESAQDLINQADKALYKAKSRGRNCVVCSECLHTPES